MTIDVSHFLLGLALLWFPRGWMRRGVAFLRRRRRSADSTRITEPWKDREPGDQRIAFKAEFSKLRNYIDLFRAAAGSLMLVGGMGMPAAIGIGAGAGPRAGLVLMVLRNVVLLIAVLIQAVRLEKKRRVTFYPAIFFIAGLSVGLCGPRGAAFAFVSIWAINPVVPSAQAFLTTYALLMVVFGHFFGLGGDVTATFAAALCFLPVLLSLLAKRPLTIFTRKGSRG